MVKLYHVLVLQYDDVELQPDIQIVGDDGPRSIGYLSPRFRFAPAVTPLPIDSGS